MARSYTLLRMAALDSEEKYRLLLRVSEAANGQLDFPGVLDAVARALTPIVPLDAIGVVTRVGERVFPHAIHIEGFARRPGESFGDTLARLPGVAPVDPASYAEGFPLAGSGTAYVERTGRAYVCQDLESGKIFAEDERLAALGIRAYVRTPLFVRDHLIGSIAFSRTQARRFETEEVEILEEVSRPIATAVSNSLAYGEIERLKNRLQEENLFLREELDERSTFGDIVGSSPALRRVLARVEKVARTLSTVLLTGETGTGKELVAAAIHKRSPRAGGPFIKVNCASLPESLIASELFGHEKGAFTGALQRRLGRFELASGGSIFLDEVGELPGEMQVALLRVLQEGEFERVGGTSTLRTDARVIAATNRDLARETAEGAFRRDLFYRLNVFPIEVPPLRDRREDIPILVEYFAARHGARLGKKFRSVDRRTMDRLLAYPWPGNVRELENWIERAAILSEGDRLSLDEPATRAAGAAAPLTLEEQERRSIEEALAASSGRVSGASGAAVRLGIPSTTLESKIRRLAIDKFRFRSA
ncbi:MAG: sigma 54-interacting transcriptional regulator [Acidobacteriota bacterium]|nr:sigma 54-interacting transcriptional regulator [Acidobacteriota bacterium]